MHCQQPLGPLQNGVNQPGPAQQQAGLQLDNAGFCIGAGGEGGGKLGAGKRSAKQKPRAFAHVQAAGKDSMPVANLFGAFDAADGKPQATKDKLFAAASMQPNAFTSAAPLFVPAAQFPAPAPVPAFGAPRFGTAAFESVPGAGHPLQPFQASASTTAPPPPSQQQQAPAALQFDFKAPAEVNFAAGMADDTAPRKRFTPSKAKVPRQPAAGTFPHNQADGTDLPPAGFQLPAEARPVANPFAARHPVAPPVPHDPSPSQTTNSSRSSYTPMAWSPAPGCDDSSATSQLLAAAGGGGLSASADVKQDTGQHPQPATSTASQAAPDFPGFFPQAKAAHNIPQPTTAPDQQPNPFFKPFTSNAAPAFVFCAAAQPQASSSDAAAGKEPSNPQVPVFPPSVNMQSASRQASAVFGSVETEPKGNAAASMFPEQDDCKASRDGSKQPASMFSQHAGAPAPTKANDGPTFAAREFTFNPGAESKTPGNRRPTRAKSGKTPLNKSKTTARGSSDGSAAPHQHPQPAPSQDRLNIQQSQLKSSADSFKAQGNAAYEAARYDTAEAAYSQAIHAMETAGLTGYELAVLYSNRAGARLMIGHPHSAVEDALKAAKVEPKFYKALSRAATCYTRLGELGMARNQLDSLLANMSASSSFFQELYQKMLDIQKLDTAMKRLVAAFAEASGNKDKLTDVLAQAQQLHAQLPFCDRRAAVAAWAHLQLGQWQKAEQATELSIKENVETRKNSPWRLWVCMQARCQQGDVAGTASLGSKLVAALSVPDHVSASSLDGLVPLPSKADVESLVQQVQEAHRLKEAGNAAVKSGKHADAIAKYTEAIAVGCPPVYAAILFCNRAAAHQTAGNLTEAIADCVRAKALDPSYHKSYSRLAAMMLDLRRPEAAQGLLEAVLSPGQCPSLGPMDKQAYEQRRSDARSASTWCKTPEHYMLLGLPRTCTEDEVKKQYRRMALKYHPDKALANCKFTAELRVQGAAPLAQATEVDDRVREESAWLFGLIGQAHEELSDAAKRRKVDQLLDIERKPEQQRGFGGVNFGRNKTNFGFAGREFGFGGPFGGGGGFAFNNGAFRPNARAQYQPRNNNAGAGAYGARARAGNQRAKPDWYYAGDSDEDEYESNGFPFNNHRR